MPRLSPLFGRYHFVILTLAGLMGLQEVRPASADDWLPVSPADLAAKDSPDKPGAHAVYLYREDIRDDTDSRDDVYERIKIFTEEGKKYADVEIPYYHDNFSITDVRARTIHPDGRIVKWNGTLLDKTIVKGQGIKVQAKVLTLPEVEVGSIIEYKYRQALNPKYIFDFSWDVQKDLFTKQAKYSFHFVSSSRYNLYWTPYWIPAAYPVKQKSAGNLALDIQNIPAYEQEDYMPPEAAVRMRVDFYYSASDEARGVDANSFWRIAEEHWFTSTEEFMGNRPAIAQEVARTVAANDPPEVKLRKLYDRAQKIRNTSFEQSKTEQEEKRENLQNNNVEDVLKHGAGDGFEIDYLFCALARAAGFDATVVRISDRNRYVFSIATMDLRQLNDVVISVKLGNRVYLDPGNPHAPYGILPWQESGVSGINLDKKGGELVTTTQGSSADAVTKRVAKLAMKDDGQVEGTLSVTFAGREALSQRLDANDEDDTARKKSLVDLAKGWLPVGATVELSSSPDWTGSESPVVAEFHIKINALGTATGTRVFLPQDVFASQIPAQFSHESRTYPIFFKYPFSEEDDVTLQLPPTVRIGSVPALQNRTTDIGVYQISVEKQDSSLHLTRKMGVTGVLYPVQKYGDLRNFFNQMKAGDEQQIVLESSK